MGALTREGWHRYGKLTGLASLPDYICSTGKTYGACVLGSFRSDTGIEFVDVEFPSSGQACQWLAEYENSDFEHLSDPAILGDLRDPVCSFTSSVVLTVTALFRVREVVPK